jgi:dethiobiotin synthetase
MKTGKAFFITGTDTGIGKTMATGCLTALLLAQGYRAVPYKPVQSGGIWEDAKLIAEDVAFYRSVSALAYEQDQLCTYCMEPAVSPHLAAQQTGTSIDPARISEQLDMLREENELVLVEGAGGLAVPLSSDDISVYMTIDLLKELRLPLLLVTHPGLGTINHTLLTAAYAQLHGIPVLGLLINRFPDEPNEMEEDNLCMLVRLTGLPVIGTLPIMAEQAAHTVRPALPAIEKTININLLLQRLEEAQNTWIHTT